MAATASSANKVALYRYWNGKDHFYTTNVNEIGTTTYALKGHHGYTCEGVACYVSSVKVSGYVPLYRYWNGKDHFYTTNAHEIGTDVYGVKGKYGYTCEGIAGYVPSKGTPLYRYWNGTDHFYTTNAQEIGTTTYGLKGHHGYTCEGIACHTM